MKTKTGYISLRNEVLKVFLEPGKRICHGEHYWGNENSGTLIHSSHVTTKKKALEQVEEYKKYKPGAPLEKYNHYRSENDKVWGYSIEEISAKNLFTKTIYEDWKNFFIKKMKESFPKMSKAKVLRVAAITLKYWPVIKQEFSPYLTHFHEQLAEDLKV